MAKWKVYVRCNSGHYFHGSVCPFDGWSVEHVDSVIVASLRLSERHEAPTVERLAGEGVPEEVLKRTIVIQFSSDPAVFDALDPSGLIIGGEWVPLRDAPIELK